MSLQPIFNPACVAIIGASPLPGRAGYRFAQALLRTEFRGQMFFVNPRGGEIDGRKIYSKLADVAEPIDLALIQVNRSMVLGVLEECAACGVKAVILYTSGFGESDEDGVRLEAELVRFAQRTGIRIVGPNCQGVYNAAIKLNLTGSAAIPPGDIGMISQSGGLGAHAWRDASEDLGCGFSSFVSMGNQIDIRAHEYMAHMRDDADTRAVVVYLEGLRAGSGRQFIEAVRSTAQIKPVLVIKGGRTEFGQRAANSHTGSLVGTADVFSEAMREAGAIEVEHFEELLPIAQAMVHCPPPTTNALALIGFGGGHSTLAADAIGLAGFDIPTFTPEMNEKLAQLLPVYAPKKNPVDLAGGYMTDLSVWITILRLALEQPHIGGVLIYGPWGSFLPDLVTGAHSWKSISEDVTRLQREFGKPIITYSHTGRGDVYQNATMRAGGVPVFDRISTAAAAFKALRTRDEWLRRRQEPAAVTPVAPPPRRADLTAQVAGRRYGNLTEPEAYALLKAYGISTAPYEVVASPAEAEAAAQALGYPSVLKVSEADILHKSDIGGVVVGLQANDRIDTAYAEMIARVRTRHPSAARAIVARQVSGLELFAGLKRDPHFGPVVLVGIGGVFVEVLGDIAFRLAPFSRESAVALLRSLHGAPLIFGTRGRAAANVDAMADVLLNLGRLGIDHPEIVEIDLNPVFVDRDAATVADARVIVGNP